MYELYDVHALSLSVSKLLYYTRVPDPPPCQADDAWLPTTLTAVVLTYLMFLNNLPAPAGVRVGGYSLKDDALSPIEQGAIGEVGVAGDPATVCCAPVHIAGL